MSDFQAEIDSAYKTLEKYITENFNQVALPAEKRAKEEALQEKIKGHQNDIAAKQAEIKKLDADLRDHISKTLSDKTPAIKRELLKLDAQIIACASKQDLRFEASPLDITIPEIVAEDSIAQLKQKSNLAFESINNYLKRIEKNSLEIEQKIKEKKLKLEITISEEITQQNIIKAELTNLEDILKKVISPTVDSNNNISLPSREEATKQLNEKKKEDLNVTHKIEELQADKSALEEELNIIKKEIEKQQQDISTAQKTIDTATTDKEKTLDLLKKSEFEFTSEKTKKENELKSVQTSVIDSGAKAASTEKLTAALEAEQAAIAKLEDDDNLIKNLEAEQAKTRTIFAAEKDNKAIEQLKLLHEQRLTIVRDHIKIAGYEALSRIADKTADKTSATTMTLTNTTPNFNKIPTQADFDEVLKKLQLDPNSKVTYHESGGQMGSGGQINIMGNDHLNGQKGVAAAALLGWETLNIDTEDRNLRLATAREALRIGFKHVKLNAPANDKEAQKLQRIFDIKKIALTPQLAGQKKFDPDAKSELAQLYEELGKIESSGKAHYPDGKELQKTLLQILTSQQVGELHKQETITIKDVAALAKGQKASVRMEYLNSIRKEDQIALLKEFMTEYDELHRSSKPFTGREIKAQLRTLLQTEIIEDHNMLFEDPKDKPKLQALVVEITKEFAPNSLDDSDETSSLSRSSSFG